MMLQTVVVFQGGPHGSCWSAKRYLLPGTKRLFSRYDKRSKIVTNHRVRVREF